MPPLFSSRGDAASLTKATINLGSSLGELGPGSEMQAALLKYALWPGLLCVRVTAEKQARKVGEPGRTRVLGVSPAGISEMGSRDFDLRDGRGPASFSRRSNSTAAGSTFSDLGQEEGSLGVGRWV